MTLPSPPQAREVPFTIDQLGHTRVDEFHWMKDPNWRDALADPANLDPAIRAHLETERAYADAVLAASTGDLPARIFDELVGRMEPEESSVPSPHGPWEYYTRYRDGGEHPLVCRRPRGSDEELILLDGDDRAEGLAFYDLGGATHSPDHRLLAVMEDDSGNEDYSLRFLDVTTNEWFDETIDRVTGGTAWAGPSRVLYTLRDEAFRSRWVMVHELGTDPTEDRVLHEETDDGFFTAISPSLSGAMAFIVSSDHYTTEVRFVRTDDPALTPVLIADRVAGVEYHPTHHGDRFLILTNLNADDYRIVEAPIDAPGSDRWEDVVPHRPGVLIEGQIVFERHHVRLERADALPRIIIADLETGEERELSFEEEAYALGVSSGYEQDTTNLRFTYSSLSTPRRTYDLDMTTGERILRKEQVIPSGHDPSQYIVRRLQAVSHDGETVPISLVHHVDTPIDGTAPAVLLGYGAYGTNIPASFSPHRFSLIDRGFVWAVAHVRGSKAKGHAWFLAGSGEHRPNTHHDFIAAAEHLITMGYSAKGRIACHGRSAGGLLVGAVANMRPDLWGAVLGDVPFVDALNTMSDLDLPLTPPEWPLWGNPLEDEAAYATIASYAPYENVAEVPYPPMFVTAGVSDPRVTYWEAAKWVARVRARMTTDAPILFHVNVNAGHFGDAGRFGYLKEDAARIAFTLSVLGRPSASLGETRDERQETRAD